MSKAIKLWLRSRLRLRCLNITLTLSWPWLDWLFFGLALTLPLHCLDPDLTLPWSYLDLCFTLPCCYFKLALTFLCPCPVFALILYWTLPWWPRQKKISAKKKFDKKIFRIFFFPAKINFWLKIFLQISFLQKFFLQNFV